MENKELVAKALSNALDGTLNVEDIVNKIERPKDSKMGDLAFPTFILAKKFRKAPQQIASDIVEKIDQNDFDHVEAAGPYVNFFLDKAKYSENVIANVLSQSIVTLPPLPSLSQSSNYGQNNDGNGGNVTIDMSSPNIAKPISMGHLRSTVIGNSVANILSKNGYKPIKDNHLGDWGTQFGKLITAYLMWGNEEDVKKDPINNLVKYYVKFHKVDKEKPELDDVARDWFRKLENGDEEATKLWKWFREVSIEAFEKIYDKLGVSFDTYNGEAFYNDKLQGVVDDLDKKGLLTKSQGATIVDLDKYNLNPALILKSDGASLYITRDIATAMYRDETYHPAMNLYVVGSEQTYYFKQLKAVLTEMGIPSAKDLHHIPFGLITVNGKKLSTRSGRIILLDEVLDDSIEIAKKQIAEKNPDLPNKDEVAKEVGVGAIVFGDLQNEKINNIDFNLEDQLRFEGETGPYVQYARARAESILRKSGKTEFSISDNKLNDAESWNIVKLLNDFPQMVKLACSEFEPSVIAKYSLRLAKAFNKYYAHTKILDDDDEKDARLALVKSVSIVLKESLRILGVKSPEEM